MKRWINFAAGAVASLSFAASSNGAITGQWDFNTDLSATIGQPIYVLDSETDAAKAFGTTTSFGIPGIGGQEARVMKFPKTPAEFGGFGVQPSAVGNGGGFGVNQYTVIMDVFFPTNSSGKRRALINTDLTGDAEFFIQANNGIGAGSASDGQVTAGTWHRIAFAVDLSANPSVLDKFVDGVKVGTQRLGGVDSSYALLDTFYLFNDDNDETEAGYINSLQISDEKLNDGLIAALGGPTANGILTGPPPNPYITAISPSPETARVPSRSTVPPNTAVSVSIHDGLTKVVPASIVLKFDDAVVVPQVTKSGDTTTISYTSPTLLDQLSIHRVTLNFSDDSVPAKTLGTQWQFAVGSYTPLSDDIALPLGSSSTRGFTARTVQGPEYLTQVNNPTNLAATVQRGIQQLNGTLRDVDGNLVADESLAGTNTDGSSNVDGALNFSTDEEVGYFLGDQFFPGIPGQNGHSTQFATEFLGYLELPAGTHKLGVTVNASRVDVNDDDNFAIYMGQNPRDFFSQVLGPYSRSTAPAFNENSQNDNEFTFFAPKAGIYPIRIVYVQSGRKGSFELYSINTQSGEKVLVNDAANPGAIKAFRNTTSSRAGAPYIAELAPRPDTSGNDPAKPVQVVVSDSSTQLNPASVQLIYNGATVTPTVSKSGRLTTISYQPNPTRTQTSNEIRFVYADNAGTPNRFTNQWAFTSSVKAGDSRTTVRGQWDFDNGNLNATVGSPLEYFDGAGGQSEQKTQFGTTASFGIPNIDGQPAAVMKVPGDLSNKIGYKMFHGITPNGGGTKVNQYTLIMDVLVGTAGPGAASLIQIDDLSNSNDGDLFWQGNNFGQGQGGYVGTGIFTPGQWHRVSIAVDLAATPPIITKYIDGVKQHDWSTDGLDGRRALNAFAILFADGDADERREWYVNSVQVREGRMSDGELAFLGAPKAGGIARDIPRIDIAGQWDFNSGLNPTVGRALEFFDGAGGESETKTQFGTASSFGIPLIKGSDVNVMRVPGDLSNKIGYKMRHGIAPNGGGTLVNQYTLTFDVLVAGQGPGAASMLQTDDLSNSNDGDLFWQGNNYGQGQGGYVGTGNLYPGRMASGLHRGRSGTRNRRSSRSSLTVSNNMIGTRMEWTADVPCAISQFYSLMAMQTNGAFGT